MPDDKNPGTPVQDENLQPVALLIKRSPDYVHGKNTYEIKPLYGEIFLLDTNGNVARNEDGSIRLRPDAKIEVTETNISVSGTDSVQGYAYNITTPDGNIKNRLNVVDEEMLIVTSLPVVNGKPQLPVIDDEYNLAQDIVLYADNVGKLIEADKLKLGAKGDDTARIDLNGANITITTQAGGISTTHDYLDLLKKTEISKVGELSDKFLKLIEGASVAETKGNIDKVLNASTEEAGKLEKTAQALRSSISPSEAKVIADLAKAYIEQDGSISEMGRDKVGHAIAAAALSDAGSKPGWNR